jgi:osmotically-inducible protein OsmY
MRQESRNVFRTDTEIENAIGKALEQDPRVYSFEVMPKSDLGRVTLTGVVDNAKARRAAEEDAGNTLGVWSVQNHIRVRPRTKLSDDELIKRVSRALHRDPYLDRENITVTSYHGKVYLYGMVDDDFDRTRAEEDAIRVNGVIQVEDYLTVRGAKRVKSDWEIKRDIQDRLLWDASLYGDSINVQVHHKEATLTGTVDSRYEYRQAEKDAYAGGAKLVFNDLHLVFPNEELGGE